jgi:hypothetical protein
MQWQTCMQLNTYENHTLHTDTHTQNLSINKYHKSNTWGEWERCTYVYMVDVCACMQMCARFITTKIKYVASNIQIKSRTLRFSTSKGIINPKF